MANSIFIQPWQDSTVTNIIISGTGYFADGLVGTPSRTYTLDTDLGSYRIGANNEGFCAGGALIFDYNASRVLFAQPIQVAKAGSAVFSAYNSGSGNANVTAEIAGSTTGGTFTDKWGNATARAATLVVSSEYTTATGSILNVYSTANPSTPALFVDASSRVGMGLLSPSQRLTLGSTDFLGWDNAGTADIMAGRLAAGQLILRQDSTHGVALDVATDGTAKLLSRAGADTAINQAFTFRASGYSSGARSTVGDILSITTAVTLAGASTGTGNVIPAGATVTGVSTTTTTTITGATGYTVGDGSDVDRYGDITGTAIGTKSGSTNYTADPRWWTNAARAITLTAKTSNFTGGVTQVTVFYRAETGA